MHTPLVGEHHRNTIQYIRDRFHGIGNGEGVGRPAVVILEGVSGVGKSRVIREFYSQIRAERSDDYWPALVSEPDESYSPLAVRKQIGPPIQGFTWASGALPTFGWWEFNGEKMSSGITMSMDRQAEDVISAHARPIALATMKKAGFFERLKGVPGAAFKDVRNMGENQILDRLLGLLAETADGVVPVPGLKLALKWVKGGYAAAKEARDERDALAHDVAQDQEVAARRSEMATLLADSVLGMASEDVPGVVVIEDMHLMGEQFRSFLDRITDQDNPRLLVIGTAWPDAETLGRSRENTKAYRNWRDGAVENGQAEVLPLVAPAQADRIEIVRKWAPNISQENAVSLTEKVQNPLALELIMTSRRTKVALRRNSGDFPEGYIARTPHELDDIYHERLSELDGAVRKSLAAVAGSIPNDHQERTWPFVREHIASAIEQGRSSILVEQGFGVTLAGSIRELMIDTSSQTWLVPSGVADTFREALMAEVAAKHLSNDLGLLEDVKAEVLWYLGEWLAARTDYRHELPRTAEARILSQWYLAMVGEARTVEGRDAEALLSAAYLVASEQAAVEAYQEATETMNAALNQVDDGLAGSYVGLLPHAYLEWIQNSKVEEADGIAAAVAAADDLAKRAEAALPVSDPSHIDWLFTRALLHEDLNHVDEAIRLLETAFERLPGIEGEPQLMPDEIEQHRFDLYERAGRIDDAISVLAGLVNDARSTAAHAGYRSAMTTALAELLERHDRGVPGDYFEESDEEVAVRNEDTDSRAQAGWNDVQGMVRNGSPQEGADRLAALYKELDSLGLWNLSQKLDNSCQVLAMELIGDGHAPVAAEFLALWREFRPSAVGDSNDWLLAKALTESGKTLEAIDTHERGLDHWIRIPGATAGDRGVFEHRLGLTRLRVGFDHAKTLAEDLIHALGMKSAVPDPASSPDTEPNWLMEHVRFQRIEPGPWAETWIKLRGEFVLNVVSELRAHQESLPADLLTRMRFWEQIGRAATHENAAQMRELHREFVDDKKLGADSVEAAAAELLAERLDQLQNIREERQRNAPVPSNATTSKRGVSTGMEIIDSHVEKLLERMTGQNSLQRDEDGDWPFRMSGENFLFVRTRDQNVPRVELRGHVGSEFPASVQLLLDVHEINRTLLFCRACLYGNKLVIESDLVATDLDQEELEVVFHSIVNALGRISDEYVESWKTAEPLADE